MHRSLTCLVLCLSAASASLAEVAEAEPSGNAENWCGPLFVDTWIVVPGNQKLEIKQHLRAKVKIESSDPHRRKDFKIMITEENGDLIYQGDGPYHLTCKAKPFEAKLSGFFEAEKCKHAFDIRLPYDDGRKKHYDKLGFSIPTEHKQGECLDHSITGHRKSQSPDLESLIHAGSAHGEH